MFGYFVLVYAFQVSMKTEIQENNVLLISEVYMLSVIDLDRQFLRLITGLTIQNLTSDGGVD